MVWASYTHDSCSTTARRGVLVHRRCRLGHRAQLHRLRPARQRRHHADVRGRPQLPGRIRFWQVIDKHQVNIFYTAPTAMRALMREGDAPVTRTSRASLRLLGSVGEPINPEAWLWYYRVVGDGRCPIVDTWWQTETGGILISPLPGATALKPGSATLPLPGVVPLLVDAEGRSWTAPPRAICASREAGPARCAPCSATTSASCRPISPPSRQVLHRRRRPPRRRRLLLDHRPGRRRHQRLRPPHGHRRGGERAGGAPEGRRGGRGRLPARHQGPGHLRLCHAERASEPTEALRAELVAWVRKEIGPIAAPDAIQWAPGLPKTRSGKIMRRILRKIAANETDRWATPRPWPTRRGDRPGG